MDFAHSEKVRALQQRLSAFMDRHVYPNEAAFEAEVEANRKKGNPWVPTRVVEGLKEKAKAEGLWNLDRKSTRLNSSHSRASRMPSSA